MNDIYKIVFGIMLILIIFGVIFEVEKKRLEREAQIEKQIKSIQRDLDELENINIIKENKNE